MTTEAWQRGPVPGFDPLLMPVVHALIQALPLCNPYALVSYDEIGFRRTSVFFAAVPSTAVLVYERVATVNNRLLPDKD